MCVQPWAFFHPEVLRSQFGCFCILDSLRNFYYFSWTIGNGFLGMLCFCTFIKCVNASLNASKALRCLKIRTQWQFVSIEMKYKQGMSTFFSMLIFEWEYGNLNRSTPNYILKLCMKHPPIQCIVYTFPSQMRNHLQIIVLSHLKRKLVSLWIPWLSFNSDNKNYLDQSLSKVESKSYAIIIAKRVKGKR